MLPDLIEIVRTDMSIVKESFVVSIFVDDKFLHFK